MDLVSKAKTLQTEIARLLRNDDIEQLGTKYDDIDAIYRVLNLMTQEVKLVRQNCQNEIVSRLKKIRCDIEILDNDVATAAEIQQLQSRDHGTKDVAPGIALPVITVATEDFIPDTPLYYVRSTEEFACRINGTVIRGRILDFSTGASSVKCRRGMTCTAPLCPWGHSTASTDDGQPRALKTWSPGNWLFTANALEKKNLHMRHIGSRSTLQADIAQATRVELADRAQQTAHDLLVMLAIDNQTRD